MSKYQPLSAFLKGKFADHVPMTFEDIERVLGFRLPASAYVHPAWWANDTGKGHAQSKAWLSAGYRTEQIDRAARKLVFSRIATQTEMAESPADYMAAEATREKKHSPHPALGSMRGTFTIEPGYDLTSPMFTDEEWAEIEKEMDEDWDQIEQGLTGKNK